MINNTDAVRLIDANREDAVVVPTMNAGNVRFGLPSVTTNQNLDLPISGAMGKASNVGLGIALAQPSRKVMVLDGDGSLLMNLGALVTTSTKAPKNFYHFLFNNGVYAVTGGQPIPGSDGVTDWEQVASGAGYAAVFSFDNLEDFTTGISEVLGHGRSGLHPLGRGTGDREHAGAIPRPRLPHRAASLRGSHRRPGRRQLGLRHITGNHVGANNYSPLRAPNATSHAQIPSLQHRRPLAGLRRGGGRFLSALAGVRGRQRSQGRPRGHFDPSRTLSHGVLPPG